MNTHENERYCRRCGNRVPMLGIHPCAPKKTEHEVSSPGEQQKATSTPRTAKWRAANREKARNYMREYMRKRRAKQNKESS